MEGWGQKALSKNTGAQDWPYLIFTLYLCEMKTAKAAVATKKRGSLRHLFSTTYSGIISRAIPSS